MGSIVRHFVWSLKDIDLGSTSGYFCLHSPTFSIADSQCKFYLQFCYSGGLDQVSVFLCRHDDDLGVPEVTVKFLLTLQSVRDGRRDTYRSTLAFTGGKSDGFNVGRYTHPTRDRVPRGDFVVVCETLNPAPAFNHTSADIDVLSEDLYRLLVSGDFANAQLVTGDCAIPVHREILSVRSPVFERMFKTSVYLETPFSAPVVRAMLAFVYSANIARVDIGEVSLEQLMHCARHYGVSELSNMLAPSVTVFTTTVDRKKEVQVLRFKNFTGLCEALTQAEHPPVRMTFDENVEMAATVFLDPYVKSGELDVKISLRNLSNVKSVHVKLHFLDSSGTWRSMRGEKTLEPDAAGMASWRFGHQSENGKDCIPPGHTLRLQFEAKFKLSDPFTVTGPDFTEGPGHEARCVETSRSFVRCMERLMESVHLSDAKLFLPPVDESGFVYLPVHSSILAARSAAFREGFGMGALNLPEKVARTFLRYVYTGNLSVSSPEAVCLLHEAAATYGINSLRIACKGVAAKMALDLKNVYFVYLIAVGESDPVLQESCKDFILRHRDIVFGSGRWDSFRKLHYDASEDIKKYVAEKKGI